jgi:sterol desaturase/sphingolipid hydroxylase (fatty acid hydroxylase superfamily)
VQTSQLILYSVPLFVLLIAVEWVYGMAQGRNTYRLNDTFCSLTLGLISRFPPAFKLGISGLVYVAVGDFLGVAALSSEDWSTWALAFLLYDFSYYWKHRLCHERTLLWASHVVHHQSEDYNLGTALRQTSSSFLLSWVFYIPMFAIGIPADVFIAIAAVNLLYQFWVHTEHIGSLGVLDRILVTPSNHRVHHARNAEYIDANYGGVFILWDRIFGTYRAERADLPPVYGTRSPLRSWNPLWANLEVYAQMLRDTWQTPKISDKWRVWTSRTGWRPVAVAARSNASQAADAGHKKYATHAPRSYRAFAVVQFFMLVLTTLWVLLDIHQMALDERAALSIWVLLSAAITAVILQGRSLAVGLEIFRSTALLMIFVVLPQSHFDPLVMQTLGLHAAFNLSAIALAWVHSRLAVRSPVNQS